MIFLGFGCTCDQNSRIIHDVGYYGRRSGLEQLECEKCPENHVPTRDKRFCIKCPKEAKILPDGCTCPIGQILIERATNGKLLNEASCVQCANGSKPNMDGSACVPCLYEPILKDLDPHCNCSLTGGLCLPLSYRSDIDISPSSADTSIRFPNSDKTIESAFFKENYEAAAFMCQVILIWNNFYKWSGTI